MHGMSMFTCGTGCPRRLLASVQNGNVELVTLLASNGADLNATSTCDREWTPLLMAAFHGHAGVVRWRAKTCQLR